MAKLKPLFIFLMVLLIGLSILFIERHHEKEYELGDTNNALLVLWTTENKMVAENMLLMYAHNSITQKWFEEVTVLVWGPSQRLLVEDFDLQRMVAEMKRDGVRFIACQACADKLDTGERLEKLDIDVFYAGNFLTEWIKSDRKLLSL